MYPKVEKKADGNTARDPIQECIKKILEHDKKVAQQRQAWVENISDAKWQAMSRAHNAYILKLDEYAKRKNIEEDVFDLDLDEQI